MSPSIGRTRSLVVVVACAVAIQPARTARPRLTSGPTDEDIAREVHDRFTDLSRDTAAQPARLTDMVRVATARGGPVTRCLSEPSLQGALKGVWHLPQRCNICINAAGTMTGLPQRGLGQVSSMKVSVGAAVSITA
jgi:hypothetical protein